MCSTEESYLKVPGSLYVFALAVRESFVLRPLAGRLKFSPLSQKKKGPSKTFRGRSSCKIT